MPCTRLRRSLPSKGGLHPFLQPSLPRLREKLKPSFSVKQTVPTTKPIFLTMNSSYLTLTVLPEMLLKLYKKTTRKVVPKEMTHSEYYDYMDRLEKGEYGPTSDELLAIDQAIRELRSIKGMETRNTIHNHKICFTDSEVYDGNVPFRPIKMRSRKEIWETFPVCVVPLGADCTGAERHAVSWHFKNLRDWRVDPVARQDGGHGPNSKEEYDDYQNVQEYFLIETLKRSSKWTVEHPLTNDQICVIRMKFVPTTSSTPSNSTIVESKEGDHVAIDIAPPRPLLPTLKRLNDIKAHYPVVWKKVEGTPRESYALEFHRGSLKTRGLVAEEVKPLLLTALGASTSWRVLPSSESSDVCIIEMA